MSTPKPPDWNDSPQDDSELSRLYRSAGEQPPAALDERIREAARNPRRVPRRGYGPFTSSWRLSVAAAAVMALCIGVVLVMENQLAERVPADGPVPKDRASTPPAARDERPAETAKIREESLPGTAQPEARRARADAAAERTESEPRAASAGEAAAPPAVPESVVDPHAPGEPAPEVWLQRIKVLFEEGDSEAAERQLAAFRQRYPDYSDAQLRRLLAPYLNDSAAPAGQ